MPARNPVRLCCDDCEEEWDGYEVTQEGTTWIEPREDCPQCGTMLTVIGELDEIDIAERKAEARGWRY